MPTSVRSHTKINLGLAIGPLRPDGFHQLTTVYQTLALHEWVTVEARIAPATRITLSSTHPRVPTDARNTAWRMVERCLEMLRLQAEVHIHIDKQLPLQGGLGAGSANAVAALIGLQHELDRRLTARQSACCWRQRSAPMYRSFCWEARSSGWDAGRRSILFPI